VQWVQQCLEQRIASYRWALERLVIHTPDNIAADADRLIGELAAQTANPSIAAQPVIGRATALLINLKRAVSLAMSDYAQ
jgi:hypothetical protein